LVVGVPVSALFGRDWLIRVDTLESAGLNCRFEVTKQVKHKPNTCTLEVYNLPPEHRDQIAALSVRKKQRGRIRVEIEAGYTGNRGLIFRGDLRTAVTQQSGGDWITKLEGADGGRSILQSRIAKSYPAGTPILVPIRACAEALGLGIGNTEALAGAARTRGGAVLASGTVLSGNAAEELTGILRSCGLTWSVQNGVVQVLRAGKSLGATTATLLSPETGLISDPQVDPAGLVFARALLSPTLIPGGRVQISTDTLRGTYTIREVKYSGDTSGLEWYADLTLRADSV
jgi:hypothetical protein